MVLHSNLQCFLDCTTPSVATQIIAKPFYHASNTLRRPPGLDNVEFFSLRNLWDQFYEWSACGAGSHVLFPSGETVVQYFVPYLSGIQLYTNKSFAVSRSSGADSRIKDWSDHNEHEKQSTLSGTISEESDDNQEGSQGSKEHLGHLSFEFFETCPPHGRVPLLNKVYELSQGFPGLTSLTSVELSPASWMSVAWYPIYHIPARCNVKELSACFLTYHALSPSFQDYMPGNVTNSSSYSNNGRHGRIPQLKGRRVSLPPFGLATYKMQESLWMNTETGDHEKVASLFNSADSWLKQLGVEQHDFNYFKTHSR
ncbi:uncharacterized protein [Typha angustifolia]|uniref:uncharacterized protein n=1 Tax=Typha angustifolia TaxID=59011 RepID=UPI003C2CCD29